MDPEKPIESTLPDESLEPTAAHFREAARLAAARVRSAMVQSDQKDPEPSALEQPDQPIIDAEMIETAAKEHARTMGGHNPEQPTETEVFEDSSAPEAIAELDERLHLGARMLRAFESQIQRIEKATHQAQMASDEIGTSRPEPDQSELESNVASLAERVSRAVNTSKEALVTIDSAIERSNSTASALASSLETASALKNGIEETTQKLTDRGQEQEARASVILHRLDVILQAMEAKLTRVLEIEESISQRIAHAEQLATRSTPAANDPEREPPVIEVEALEQKTSAEQTTTPTESTTVSYGTLSVDPELLQRRQRLERYQRRG